MTFLWDLWPKQATPKRCDHGDVGWNSPGGGDDPELTDSGADKNKDGLRVTAGLASALSELIERGLIQEEVKPLHVLVGFATGRAGYPVCIS